MWSDQSNQNNQQNQTGGWQGPPLGQPENGKGSTVEGAVAFLGLIATIGLAIYFAPPMLLITGLIIFSWIIYQCTPVIVSEFDMPSPLWKMILHHLFVVAAMGSVITLLITYSSPWYAKLLAVYGLANALSDLLYKLFVSHTKEPEKLAGGKYDTPTRQYGSSEITVLFGVPLTAGQTLVYGTLHMGGYLSLVLFYLMVCYELIRPH